MFDEWHLTVYLPKLKESFTGNLAQNFLDELHQSAPEFKSPPSEIAASRLRARAQLSSEIWDERCAMTEKMERRAFAPGEHRFLRQRTTSGCIISQKYIMYSSAFSRYKVKSLHVFYHRAPLISNFCAPLCTCLQTRRHYLTLWTIVRFLSAGTVSVSYIFTSISKITSKLIRQMGSF